MARYTGPTLLHANQNALDLARLAQKRQKRGRNLFALEAKNISGSELFPMRVHARGDGIGMY